MGTDLLYKCPKCKHIQAIESYIDIYYFCAVCGYHSNREEVKNERLIQAKNETPLAAWYKCPSCKNIQMTKEYASNSYFCVKCGYDRTNPTGLNMESFMENKSILIHQKQPSKTWQVIIEKLFVGTIVIIVMGLSIGAIVGFWLFGHYIGLGGLTSVILVIFFYFMGAYKKRKITKKGIQFFLCHAWRFKYFRT